MRARSYLNVELLLLGVSIVLLGGASLLLAHYGFTSRPEVVTTMVILLGIVVLLVAIGAFVALLRGFDLADRRFALGLPDGSVRAILALGLLLVFAMISVFLYWDAAHPPLLQSTGITAEQLAKFEDGTILAIQPGPIAGTFNVSTVATNDNAQQLGQQLVTILGTLVTAIAAFYFGATSVASATGAAPGPDGPGQAPAPSKDGGPSEGEPTPDLTEAELVAARQAYLKGLSRPRPRDK
jgi:hypothetical protein